MANLPKFRVFTFLALFFLCGILVSSLAGLNLSINFLLVSLFIITLCLSALINFLFRNHSLVFFSFCLIFLITGVLYYSWYESRHQALLPYGSSQKITGQIVKRPEINFRNQKVVIKVADLDQQEFTNDSLLLVTLPHFPVVYYGDSISFNGVIEKPGQFDNFDYGKYLKRHLIFGVVNRPEGIQDHEVKLSYGQRMARTLYYISAKFEESINWVMPEPHASLASGLILGIKRNIPQDIKDNLSVTGLTHIVALSGYNVTILIAIFANLYLKKFGKKKVFLVGSILVISFIILTGASASVVRAGIFSLLILFGKTIGRRGDFTNLMLLAALLMVIVNPFIFYYDVGFQLSFLAFAGLIYLSPIIETYINSKKYLSTIPAVFKESLVATLGAQIAVFPLILTTFDRVSLIAPLSNILVLWVIPLAKAMVAATGFATIVWYPLGKAISFLTWPILQYIFGVIQYSAQIPGASLKWSNTSCFILPIFYTILLIGTIYSYRKTKLVL